ncbi:MAG: cold shock domain-containing protein [Bacteroidales bacterium]|nr:cold shock domain-containing protein [Bacteroidales bacterium]
MGRSQETFNKKEVRNKKEKKRKEKEKKRLARKDNEKSGSLDDMLAYVDENGMISRTPPDPSKKRDIKLEDIEIGVPTRDNEPDDDPIRKGIVSFFNDSKGFGFIKDNETKQGVFVHANNLLEDIKEGNVVSFEVEMGHKGPTAVRVKIFKEKVVVQAPKPVAEALTAAISEAEPPDTDPSPDSESASPSSVEK